MKVIPKLKKVDVIWLAGLLEGEGCFHWQQPKNQYGSVVVSLEMTDFDIVNKAAKLMGAYSVTKKKGRKENYKKLYVCAVRCDKAITLMKLLLPYMGERRTKKILELIPKWETRPSHKGHMKEVWRKRKEAKEVFSYENCA